MKDCDLLQTFVTAVTAERLNVNYAQIWRDGSLTAEYKRIPVKTRLNTWSTCKGVVSCAAGIAIDEGLIRLDERIADIFPEYVPESAGPYLKEITIEHLLTMTSGLSSSLFFCDGPERYTVQDWISYFFNASFTDVPGTKWLYSNFNTYMVSCAIERRAGVNLLEYLRHRFFEPLGIGNPDWTLCPKGHVHAANGLYVTIDELSHYGEMICNYGNYHGKQIVPESYMRKATSNLVDDSACRTEGNKIYAGYGYGYQFIRNPDGASFRSDGNYGQFCIAVPQKSAVITVMSLEGNYPRIGTLLWEDVVNQITAE
ncbi:MAG: serine hydrolase [Lachnospiraceae bacterium]|nr:serine hydrolase [Lachnospiraceae bacterium]